MKMELQITHKKKKKETNVKLLYSTKNHKTQLELVKCGPFCREVIY